MSIKTPLFRGRTIGEPADQRWATGSLYVDGFGKYFIIESAVNPTYGLQEVYVEIDPTTAGLNTGCIAITLGGDNVDIYEGDLLITDDGTVLAVVWDDSAFRLATIEQKRCVDRGEHPFFDDYHYLPVLAETLDGQPLTRIGNAFEPAEHPHNGASINIADGKTLVTREGFAFREEERLQDGKGLVSAVRLLDRKCVSRFFFQGGAEKLFTADRETFARILKSMPA